MAEEKDDNYKDKLIERQMFNTTPNIDNTSYVEEKESPVRKLKKKQKAIAEKDKKVSEEQLQLNRSSPFADVVEPDELSSQRPAVSPESSPVKKSENRVTTLSKGTAKSKVSGRTTPISETGYNNGRITPNLYEKNYNGRITPVKAYEVVSESTLESNIKTNNTSVHTYDNNGSKASGRLTPVSFTEAEERISSNNKTADNDTAFKNSVANGKLMVANGTLSNGYSINNNNNLINQEKDTVGNQKAFLSKEKTTLSSKEERVQLSEASKSYVLNKSHTTPNKMVSNNTLAQSSKTDKSSPAQSEEKLWREEQDVEKAIPCCSPETKVWKVCVKLLVCVLAGVVFGWSFEKSRVFEPASIRLQMVFRRWIMLKMFLAAVAAGQFAMAVISLLPKTKEIFNKALTAFLCSIAEKKGIITSIIGPFVLGTGMTLSGACPGMVLAQTGSWTKNSIFTFLGALVAAFMYGLVAHHVVKLTKPRKPFTKHTLFETFGIPYAALALPMAGILTLIVFLLEWFINWEEDLDYYNRNDFDLGMVNTTDQNWNIFTMKSWPPSISGALIGSLQIIIIFSATDTLGGSSSYVTIVSQWVRGEKLEKWFPYLAAARSGISNWWQVFYVSGAILGSLISALASQSIASTKGVSIVTAFFGGMLMLLGARFGAGCTSGHGLSGMGLLFWMSFIAVPAMFAGGIVTGFAMDATNALEDFSCFSKYDWMCT